MFTEQQLEQLKSPLYRDHVSKRKQGGFEVSYIAGWHAIAECNRIFGFGEWERETVYCKEVSREQREVAKHPGFKVGYEAMVRITVRDESGERVTRTGTGHGSGIAKDLFDCIEGAAKEAETDAMKRALMTFGNQFGLALYDKQQRNVVSGTRPEGLAETMETPEQLAQKLIQHLSVCETKEDWEGKLHSATRDGRMEIIISDPGVFKRFTKWLEENGNLPTIKEMRENDKAILKGHDIEGDGWGSGDD